MYSLLCPWSEVLKGVDEFGLMPQNYLVNNWNLRVSVVDYETAYNYIKKGKVTCEKTKNAWSISNQLYQSKENSFGMRDVVVKRFIRNRDYGHGGYTAKVTIGGCETNCNCLMTLGTATFAMNSAYMDTRSYDYTDLAELQPIKSGMKMDNSFNFQIVCIYRAGNFYVLRTISTNTTKRLGVTFVFSKRGNPVAYWWDSMKERGISSGIDAYRVIDEYEADFLPVFKTMVV